MLMRIFYGLPVFIPSDKYRYIAASTDGIIHAYVDQPTWKERASISLYQAEVGSGIPVCVLPHALSKGFCKHSLKGITELDVYTPVLDTGDNLYKQTVSIKGTPFTLSPIYDAARIQRMLDKLIEPDGTNHSSIENAIVLCSLLTDESIKETLEAQKDYFNRLATIGRFIEYDYRHHADYIASRKKLRASLLDSGIPTTLMLVLDMFI